MYCVPHTLHVIINQPIFLHSHDLYAVCFTMQLHCKEKLEIGHC